MCVALEEGVVLVVEKAVLVVEEVVLVVEEVVLVTEDGAVPSACVAQAANRESNKQRGNNKASLRININFFPVCVISSLCRPIRRR